VTFLLGRSELNQLSFSASSLDCQLTIKQYVQKAVIDLEFMNLRECLKFQLIFKG
jgi:hypothetical protein